MSFSPQFHAINRETAMAAEMLSFGVTHLRQANHAKKGEYALSFFNLSNGFERLGKLIFLADYAISNNGSFPSNKTLKDGLGHDLKKLFNAVDQIGKSRFPDTEFTLRPNGQIHLAIYECLHRFANQAGRYYNLDSLTVSQSPKAIEPVEDWYKNVGEPILHEHYKGKKKAKDSAHAKLVGQALGGITSVLHFGEDGSEITDIKPLFLHSGKTSVVQQWSQFYCLQIIRWLSTIYYEICHVAAYEKRIEAFLDKGSYFRIFFNEDRYLKSRKTWPIT